MAKTKSDENTKKHYQNDMQKSKFDEHEYNTGI